MIESPLIDWTLVASTVPNGTRAAAAQGTSITPGNDTLGAYASVLLATAEDAHLLEVNINSVAISGQSRNALITLGFDHAGGSSFGGLGGVTGNEIANLLGSCAAPYLSSGPSGGVAYRFRVHIPAGTSIGARAQIHNASVGTLRVAVRLFRCSRPDLVRIGRFVRTFGATTASSSGTAITPGSTSDGAYVQVGTLAEPLWGWEVGLGVDSATMTNTLHEIDVAVGDSSNKRVVLSNARVIENVAEILVKEPADSYAVGATGDGVWIRAQSGPNNATANTSAIVYGVGG